MKFALQLIASIACALTLAGCGGGDSTPGSNPNTQPMAYAQIDTLLGTGAVAAANTTVTINYTGWLYSGKGADFHGTEFDSRDDYKFKLGTGVVIKGWDQGIAGMQVGGKRTLILTAEQVAGATGKTPLPPNTGLVFDIELTAVTP